MGGFDMVLQLTLTPDLEKRLQAEATRRGKREDETAVQLLEEKLPLADKTKAAVEWLLNWADEVDRMSDEEAAENEAILVAIDEDRLSDRKLFTKILASKPS
jgi:hypothetical protein